MIILITGASHTGKTVLARRLLEKTGFPFYSIDHLKMGLIRSGMTDLTPEDDAELVGFLWPIVRETIKTAIENRQDLIVEGCYVPPDWRRDLGEEYLREIRFLCLAMTDAYIDANFSAIAAHANDAEARLEDGDLAPEKLKADNRFYREAFERAGERVIPIDGDYEKTLDPAALFPDLPDRNPYI